jgi:hypothetical protein
MYVTGTRVTSLTYLHLGRMLVVKDRPTAWRNSRKVTTRTPFGVQNMHFFHFAFLLGGNHSNVLASGIKDARILDSFSSVDRSSLVSRSAMRS